MKIQIIYCHPSKDSYTYEILNKLTTNLDKEGLDYEISDLYAMKFTSDMTEEEYQREGFANIELAVAEDVIIEHKKINNSDCIIFLYPVWWSDCPSKLKGWFDRVYSVGYAYGHSNQNSNSRIKQMKSLKYGLVICTAGHTNDFLNEIGIAESMRNIMLEDRLGKRFINKEMLILGGTMDKEKVRPIHSYIIESVGSKIKQHCI